MLADRTGAEIFALVAHYGHELRGVIYFYDERRILAPALTGRPGDIHAELTEPLVEEEPLPNARVGYMALDTLLRYRPKRVSARKMRKLTDWPTFLASGAQSVKAFNRRAVRISLRTCHGAIELEAACAIKPERTYTVNACVPVSITHEELGQTLRKLVRGANILQEAGLV